MCLLREGLKAESRRLLSCTAPPLRQSDSSGARPWLSIVESRTLLPWHEAPVLQMGITLARAEHISSRGRPTAVPEDRTVWYISVN